MNENRRYVLLVGALCVAVAPTLAACNGNDASEMTPEELVGEGADEFSGTPCNWTTGNADAIETEQIWSALSFGDSYGLKDCRRFVVEFDDFFAIPDVYWDDQIATENECVSMRIVYSGYTYSGGGWNSNGTFRGHGVWKMGATNCEISPDAGYDYLSFGTGTKHRIAVQAYEKSCGPSGCYLDYKRVGASSLIDFY